ncbi:MAG: exodeoxyribonuclease V subunit alpha, partial [Acinetobacter sp.]|nr:exodeoxyribonuclease V subunit alpha [Acinetobacter sp.]
ALYRYWYWEMQLAQYIQQLATPHATQHSEQNTAHETQDLNLAIAKIKHSQDLDQHQESALRHALTQRFTLITGGPGTGKTTTLSQIIAILLDWQADIRIAMAAPTGKAAQRMKEALQGAANRLPQDFSTAKEKLKQQQPITLHRLLGLGYTQQARYHAKNPLPYDVIVVDEASMLDLNLARQLFEAIPTSCRLILLGDVNQLASVDVGSVLADLQHINALEHNRQHLLKSRRFSDDNPIGKLAKFFIEQCFNNETSKPSSQAFKQLLTLKSHADTTAATEFAHGYPLSSHVHHDDIIQGFAHYAEQLKRYYPQRETLTTSSNEIVNKICEAFDYYRVLTATQQGNFGVEQLNLHCENYIKQHIFPSAHQHKSTWYFGKAVMMTHNDYQLDLSNGDIGLCLGETADQQFMVYFPSLERWYPAARLPKDIQTAFAMTIHKSQGSEFNHTAVVLDDGAERLLSQELLYTAITRAKNALSLWYTEQALQDALHNKTQRSSRLVKKVESYYSLSSN